MIYLDPMLAGAIVMASLTVSLFFLRFWKSTRDRFFLFFAIAFALEAMTRTVLAITHAQSEDAPAYYLPRLAAYVLILIAILDKNRNRDKQ